MSTIVEAKVNHLLKEEFGCSEVDSATALEAMRSLARMAGHRLDHQFARAGLGAGPEARIASGLVDRAMLGGGAETSEYAIRQAIDHWLLTHPKVTPLW